jgi:hypothetical protein
MNKLPDDINKFEMLNVDDNKATVEDLFEYAKNFKQWCHELSNNKKYAVSNTIYVIQISRL